MAIVYSRNALSVTSQNAGLPPGIHGVDACARVQRVVRVISNIIGTRGLEIMTGRTVFTGANQNTECVHDSQ